VRPIPKTARRPKNKRKKPRGRPRKIARTQLTRVQAAAAGIADDAPPPQTAYELARRLYERSPLTLARIARIFAVHKSSLPRIAKREGWMRRRHQYWTGRAARLTESFHFAVVRAAHPAASPAAFARTLAACPPEELVSERAEIVARIWSDLQEEIARENERLTLRAGTRALLAEARQGAARARAIQRAASAPPEVSAIAPELPTEPDAAFRARLDAAVRERARETEREAEPEPEQERSAPERFGTRTRRTIARGKSPRAARNQARAPALNPSENEPD
jgi:hypothetical protein